MKNSLKFFGVIRSMAIIALVAVIGFSMTACPSGGGGGGGGGGKSSGGGDKTPVAGDYTFGNLNQTEYEVAPVTITPKSGKSSGAVSNIRYSDSIFIPQTAGTYNVTFDVEAVTGWNDATGLSAGKLTVNKANQTPYGSDYTIGNLTQTAGSVTAVTITPKSGKSSGKVSNIRYNNSTTIPQTAGLYYVTFNVAAATGWNAATDLYAALLMVNPNGSTSTFTTISSFETWLAAQSVNTAATPHYAILNISSLGGNSSAAGSIGKALMDNRTKYVSLNLSGSNITGIENNAFARCRNLTRITIPNSVTSIGQSAFSGCTGLTSVSIPDSVTSIGNFAFAECESLTGISIPSGVTGIGEQTFSFCYNLTRVSIPNSVTSIGKSAFAHCSRLADVIMGLRVTGIGEQAFYGCIKLNNISMLTILGTVTGIGESAFSDCTSLASIYIDSVTGIGKQAFYGCTDLAGVTMGNKVTSIGDEAFYICYKLTSVTFAGTIPSTGFSNTNPFSGDLRAKFYASNSTNGTAGTYTRPIGSNTWTKQ